MNILNKPIEMVTETSIDGKIKPIRFRVKAADEEWVVIKIKCVQHTHEERISGSKDLIRKYICLVEINDRETLCEIKYDLTKTTWTLVKM